MLIRINKQSFAIGENVDPETLDRADLRHSGMLQRLLRSDLGGLVRLQVENCSVDCFEGAFNLYPCTDSYLTPDRQWCTAAEIEIRNGRLISVLLKVIQGRYAAAEFVDRFRTSCMEILGAPDHEDRWVAHWRNGAPEVTCVLQNDAMNASFLIAEKSPAD